METLNSAKCNKDRAETSISEGFMFTVMDCFMNCSKWLFLNGGKLSSDFSNDAEHVQKMEECQDHWHRFNYLVTWMHVRTIDCI